MNIGNNRVVRDTRNREMLEKRDDGSCDVLEDWSVYDGPHSDLEDGIAGNIAAVEEANVLGRNEGIDAAATAMTHKNAADACDGEHWM